MVRLFLEQGDTFLYSLTTWLKVVLHEQQSVSSFHKIRPRLNHHVPVEPQGRSFCSRFKGSILENKGLVHQDDSVGDKK